MAQLCARRPGRVPICFGVATYVDSTQKTVCDLAAAVQKIRRALIVLLAVVAALLLLAAFALRAPKVVEWVRTLPIGPDVGPTPPRPVIAAPAGPLPDGLAGLTELAQYGTQDFRGVGSGFLLRLPGGNVIGVTTAHSVAALGLPGNDLQHLLFSAHVNGTVFGPPAYFDDLYGPPGAPFSGDDLSVDYVLLQPQALPDTNWAQDPDPRGAAQPGERVALYSGLGSADGSARGLLGTVLTSTPAAAWVLMDDRFDPNGMSGSPVFSGYTGRVVGMAVAAAHKRGRLLIGLNPIGALVAHALAARDFPAIAGYIRQ